MRSVTQFADITIQTPTIHRLDLELIPSTSTSKTKLDETKITGLLQRLKVCDS